MTKTIELTHNLIALVDDDDYAEIVQLKWCATKTRSTGRFYAATRLERSEEGVPGRLVFMHRMIMNIPHATAEMIDHRNGDTLDNRKINLRFCTMSENGRNRGKQVNNTSGYKGVAVGREGKWQCAIKLHGKRMPLGIFDDPVEAARVYDRAALIYHGEFARLNFPDGHCPPSAGLLACLS